MMTEDSKIPGKLSVAPQSIVSIHDQIVAYFSEEINNGRLAAGDMVLSENALANQLQVSRMTVRRAFDTLVHAGLLVRHPGKGTFVAEFTRESDMGLIGFIGQTLMTGISSEIVAHINRAIEARGLSGWHLLVCGAQNDPEKQLHYVETLQTHRVRGIILAPAVLDPYDSNVKTLLALRGAGLPFVLVDRYVEQVDSDYVVSDNFELGYVGTQHLISLGHQRIAFITGAGATSIIQRENGYRAALEAAGLSSDPNLIIYWPSHTVELEGARIEAILKRGATAIFSYSERAAIRVINWCASRGIRIPEDIAVVGAGDLRILEGASPILTTVRQDFKAMAEKALDILLNRIERRVQKGGWQHEVLDVELAIRQSCGAKLISPSNRIEEAGV